MANLTWGQFAKRNRFENNVTVLYNRAKNNEPMHFVDKQGSINGDGMRLYVKYLHMAIPKIKRSI